MFENTKGFYSKYKRYIRVDLLMYGVMLLAIVLFFALMAIFRA